MITIYEVGYDNFNQIGVTFRMGGSISIWTDKKYWKLDSSDYAFTNFIEGKTVTVDL